MTFITDVEDGTLGFGRYYSGSGVGESTSESEIAPGDDAITRVEVAARATGLLGACAGDSGGDDNGAHDDGELSDELSDALSSSLLLLPEVRTMTADAGAGAEAGTVERRWWRPRRGWVTIWCRN